MLEAWQIIKLEKKTNELRTSYQYRKSLDDIVLTEINLSNFV